MRFSIYQDSAIGNRTVNQDRMGYCFSTDSLLMILADGMGGHLRGEIAAQIALQSIGAAFQLQASPKLADPVAFLDASLRKAHRDILRYQDVNFLPESPRTTIVTAIVQDGSIWWAHAGDSRVYLLRNRELIARSRDHSKVQTLLALGLIDPSEEDTHPERNKVLNCLGSPFEPTVEINPPIRLRVGDRVLLSSDGLWSGVAQDELARVLFEKPVDAAIPELIQIAVMHNGHSADNCTGVGMMWEGDGAITAGVATDVLSEGSFTTTIIEEIPASEPQRDLTEDEIERTISEIKTAIERSNSR